jgi:diguanylate cyclase (GGDEF)-like protein
MMGLDLRSVILMSGLLGVMLSVVMLFLRLSYPRTIRGMGYWAGAGLLAFGSTFLFGGRGLLPDLLTVVGANVSLLAGVTMLHLGLQRFFGVALSWRLWAGVLALLAPALAWFTLAMPDFNARVMLVTVVWAALQLSMAWLVWRRGPEVFSTRYTVVVLLLHAGVIVLRFLTALLPLPDEGLLEPTRVQTLYIASNAMMLLALYLGLILMVSDRLRETLEHSASHDALTNALNRRSLIEACERELERCRRHGHRMALLMLDVDHFKAINDTYGHLTGDRVLVSFVIRVRDQLRRLDQLGRFGGEEFLVLLPETSPESALLVAERIRTAVARTADGLPALTVSIGVTGNRTDETDIDELLARADRALYMAKTGGRNRIAEV